MTIVFERPVGASADLKELEYISALHQTCSTKLRQDASITAADIRLFLRSRYGILVDEEELQKTVISGLGGGDSAEEIIDLMEVVCMLLIPTLLKASRVETDDDFHLSKDLPEGVIPPEPDLIKNVLTMMLEDVTGDATSKPLNERLVASLFEAYGEMDLAKDSSLHKAMIQAANPTGRENAKLDVNTFSSGLVTDIQEYDLKNETRTTCNLEDVLLTRGSQEFLPAMSDKDLSFHDVENKRKRSTPLLTEWTAQSIDSTAGNYRNKYLMVTLVATVIITYFAYWYDPTMVATSGLCPEYAYDYYAPWTVNSGTIACEVGFSLLSWLTTFVVFSAFGLFFVGLGSLGNGIGTVKKWWSLVGFVVVFLLVVPAYVNNGEVRAQYFLDTASLVLGIVAMALHLFNFLVLVCRTQSIEKNPWLKRLLRSSRLEDRKDLKQAGQHKLNQLIKNALKIHTQNEERSRILGSHFARALHGFASNIDPVEKEGGFRWTWRRLLDNSLIDTYGIWLSDRLLSGNLVQYIVSIYILVVGFQISFYLIDEYSKENARMFIHNVTWDLIQPIDGFEGVESLLATFTGYIGSYMAGEAGDCTNATILTPEEVESLCSVTEGVYDCHEGASRDIFCTLAHSTYNNDTQLELSHQLALLTAAGFNVTGLEESAIQSIEDATISSVDSLYPSSEYMIRIPLIVGTATAFMTSVYLAVTFLPSITSTILQLRCGFIPTMANKDFNKYRCAPDQVSILTGSMFWGTLLGSFLIGSFLGVLVFFCLWQATVYYMAKLFAILGGILVIAIIRISVLSICRCGMHRAFYRERPFSANISLLALEWANFTLSVGFILVRIIKLIISACMFIGRIDTPFLAPKVGQLGPIELDNYPTIFMKDLLQHEAHRHPYIEMLGVMYLMKLRYRDSFGSKAGAAWRLLFVYSLLPWMHKYRIHIKGEVGFILQGLAESTRGEMSILMSQRLSPEDMEEDDDEGKVYRRETSRTTYQLERANMELRNRLDLSMQRERDLLATISDLEDKMGKARQTMPDS
ncbi:hypothetical protein IV203_001012 [Nitzschia inconspicua]|uniref:Uncharacterized protein n=1 Tax=Nitzschia inconspicua TaxID=303405 RepID=A0A9K3L8M0_9STRA|nr:hypothetical protein IV203_001012 [Nitzschia inconspicua]